MKHGMLVVLFLLMVDCAMSETQTFYVGADGEAGLLAYSLDGTTGSLREIASAKNVKNTSFFTLSANNKFMYLTCERSKVRAYKINDDHSVTLLNEKEGFGCHVELSKSGRSVTVSQYHTGKTVLVSVGEDGKLTQKPSQHDHRVFEVSKIDSRHMAPHPHNVCISPNGNYAFICDLGLDKIVVYRYDKLQEKMTLAKDKTISMPPGSGPRHMTFHQNKKFAYTVNETSANVTAFHYDGSGGLTAKQHIPALPTDWKGEKSGADIHVHPNGRFLYASIRGGYNKIVIYEINQEDGTLALVGRESTRGDHPRNFAINHEGTHLLVANKISGDVYLFAIDGKTGLLAYANQKISVPQPMCVKFLSSSPESVGGK